MGVNITSLSYDEKYAYLLFAKIHATSRKTQKIFIFRHEFDLMFTTVSECEITHILAFLISHSTQLGE
jgi:hypothetical protein